MHPLARVELRCRQSEAVSVEVVSHPDAPVTTFEGDLWRHWDNSLPEAWRLEFWVAVGPLPIASHVRRRLDLSRGSPDRRFADAVVQRGALRFAWLREGVEHVVEFTEHQRMCWQRSLELTREIDRERWRTYWAEQEWKELTEGFPSRYTRFGPLRQTPAPARPIPYFAARRGAIPVAGTPTIAGISLPLGTPGPASSQPTYWAAIEPRSDWSSLTRPLVAAFPETGLWPVLWNFDSDGPDGNYRGLLSTAAVGTVDLAEFMRAGWEDRKTDRWMSGPPAPEPCGLAEPSPAAATLTDPFAEVNSFPDPRWLMLVSCNRPADVTAVLDWQTPLPHSVITTFLRSWEERFGAVPVQLDGAHVSLHVTAPPTSEEQAARLLDEFNVAGGWQYEEDGAEAFRRRPRHVFGPDDMTPTLWQFWPANRCPEGFAVEDTRPHPPLEIDGH